MITLYTDDLPRLTSFYEGLDFHVTSRSPSHGDPVHVELTLDRFTIGISTVTAAREDHGLSTCIQSTSLAAMRPRGKPGFCDTASKFAWNGGALCRLSARSASIDSPDKQTWISISSQLDSSLPGGDSLCS